MKGMKNFLRSFIIFSILISVVLVFSSQTASHEVQKGETLYSISRKYGISVGELCSENNISTSAVIKTGQKLKIPTQNSSETKNTQKIEKTDTYIVKKDYNISIPHFLHICQGWGFYGFGYFER